MKKIFYVILILLVYFGVILVFESQAKSEENNLTPIEFLGKNLFFDANLSTPIGQSCAACHDPETGFTGPLSDLNTHGAVYEGAVNSRFGKRHPPTAAYAGESSPLYYNETMFQWIGGMFFDGRATGWTLGDPLAEQAQAPFLNPLEQNNLNSTTLVEKVRLSDYSNLFEQVWGNGSLDNIEDAYEKIGRSIAAYERSNEVNPFSSKYDFYLKGQTKLTETEALGLELFQNRANCESCHPSEPNSNGGPPLFTDFSYRNVGIPKNPENPFYSMPLEWNPEGENYIDYGLGGFLKNNNYSSVIYESKLGAQKVPTLRNVDLRPYEQFVKSYGHNGYFKTLEDIIHFYNTRDVEDWPEPEVSVNMDSMFMGNLGLTSEEETSLVAFFKTLSDGYKVEPIFPSDLIIFIAFISIIVIIIVYIAIINRRKITKKLTR